MLKNANWEIWKAYEDLWRHMRFFGSIFKFFKFFKFEMVVVLNIL